MWRAVGEGGGGMCGEHSQEGGSTLGVEECVMSIVREGVSVRVVGCGQQSPCRPSYVYVRLWMTAIPDDGSRHSGIKQNDLEL